MPVARSKLVVPIGISFDAQNTLVEIVGGMGHQYFKHFRRFLLGKGFSIEDVMPSCTATSLQTTSYTIMRYNVNRDRDAWAKAHPESNDRTEMPIGGRTEASILAFWRSVLTDVFKSPSLYLSTPPRLKQSLLDVMEGEEWEAFLKQVLDAFASSKVYGWLPEGKRTLEELRKWTVQQEQHAFQLPLDRTKTKPLMVLQSPPYILTNSDFRLRGAFQELGAFVSPSPSKSCSSDGKKLPPLIGKVVTAADVGYAKPSSRGILHCLRECGLERHPDRFIHVGDAEADEMACRKAGCRFLHCNGNTGVQWEKLKMMLADMEEEVIRSL